MTRITAILASDIAGNIGNQGKLPWPLNRNDLRFFKNQTTGKTILMGRSTWESIGSTPLPDRKNLVMTSDDNLSGYDGATIVRNLEEASEGRDHLYLIGGKQMYESFIHQVSEILWTEIHDGPFVADARLDLVTLFSGFYNDEMLEEYPDCKIWRLKRAVD